MKQIIIKSIALKNFKGLKCKELKLSNNVRIYGANGTGKTTIFDAFTWLLFGKDSSGRTSFDIKPLDKKNKTTQKTEVEVSAVIAIDSEEVILRRVLKEKWVKQRGASNAVFTGNTVDYYWNDVPKSQREFQDNIKDLVDENVFKMITNPLAFSQLNWQDARTVLVSIIGGIDDQAIANGNKDFEELMAKLTNKSLDDYKKILASQRKLLNDAIKGIPTRIDEVETSKPETIDFEALEKEKAILDRNLSKIEVQIDDRNKAYEASNKKFQAKEKESYELRSRLSEIKYSLKNSIDIKSHNTSPADNIKFELQGEESILSGLKSNLRKNESDLKHYTSEISRLNTESNKLRDNWIKENATELKIDENDLKCPTCRRELDTEDIEAEKERMLKDFKTDKANTLAKITKEGLSIKESIKSLEKDAVASNKDVEESIKLIESAAKKIDELNKKLSSIKEVALLDVDKELEKELLANEEYQKGLMAINSIEDMLKVRESVNISDLKEEREKINLQVDIVMAKLRTKEEIAKANKRIAELEKEESSLAQQISDLEQQQYIVEQFVREQITVLETKVNKLFKIVNFKLFETQVNGAEAECCIPLIEGVPFSSANTASKINAGIDIINALCEFYQVNAPVFVDNRESVTKIIDTKSQLISLIVSPEHKQLTLK